jgi:hypothetical protein
MRLWDYTVNVLTVDSSVTDGELGMVTFSSTSLLYASSYILYPRAQFARRDSVYYQSISAKSQDAFVIVCTITSTSSPTTLLPPGSNLSVPKTLIDTVGSLLDDPLYSDVEFVIMRPRNSPKARRIWASRKLLQRAEHFDDSGCGNLGYFLSADTIVFSAWHQFC